MPHQALSRPAPGSIPTDPGVYRFRDGHDRVIYVGKAKNLRNRLNSYFVSEHNIRPISRRMLSQAASVDWTVVRSEEEALQLEWTWIHQFEPRYNIQFRDGKSYPLLAISTAERYPRVWVYRGKRRKNIRYFGPYTKVGALRDTVELLTRVFPVRTCTNGVMRRHTALGRPCLLGYIGKCSAPCVGNISEDDYRKLINQITRFMTGTNSDVQDQLREKMQTASKELAFEEAARYRDQLAALDGVLEKQTVVLDVSVDADVVGIVTDEISASVQLFRVRGGRIRGQQGWVVTKTGEADLGEWEADSPDPALTFLVESFLQQYYQTHRDDIPRLILVPTMPSHSSALLGELSLLRGSNVELRVPQRGAKAALAETVTRNAAEKLRQHKLSRASDLSSRSAALEELQHYLGMDEAPLRIECTDISHLQGTDVVASLVVFEDGLPKKLDYRTYLIKDAAGDGHSNDVASIAEVTRRRFSAKNGSTTEAVVKDSQETIPGEYPPDELTGVGSSVEHGSTSPGRFSYPPQLFIVDGGAPQVAAASAIVEELGVPDLTVIGLAKRLEEVWLAGEEYPLILPRDSEALFLLQRVRDESHRTAIGFHRKRRSKSMIHSEVEDLPGIGPARHEQLMKHFGTVKRLKEATVEEISKVPGFGQRRAEQLFTALHN